MLVCGLDLLMKEFDQGMRTPWSELEINGFNVFEIWIQASATIFRKVRSYSVWKFSLMIYFQLFLFIQFI